MAEDVKQASGAVPVVSQEQLRQAEAYIEAEEGVVNRLFGWAGIFITSKLKSRICTSPARIWSGFTPL